MAQKYWYWGYGNLIVIVTAFTGRTAVYISSVQGASRIVFSLAPLGLLPSQLAYLAGEKRVPRNVVINVLVAVVVLDLASLYLLGNGLDSSTWWANALVFFATLTLLAVNVANPFLLHRIAPGGVSVVEESISTDFRCRAERVFNLDAVFLRNLWGQVGARVGA